MAVTNAGKSVPSNTAYSNVLPEHIVYLEASDANIKAGNLVGFSSGQAKVISSTSNGGGQGLNLVGIALDNEYWDATNHKQYAWDDAFPAGYTVPIAKIGSGAEVVARADGSGVVAGQAVILTAGATAGLTTVAGASPDIDTVAGKALTSATSGVYLLQL